MKNRKINTIEKQIIFGILFSPLLLYFHLLIPEVNEFTFYSATFKTVYHSDFQVLVWYTIIMVNIFWLLCLWFYTNKEWWRYTLIPLMSYTFFSFISMLNDELYFLESFDIKVFLLIFIVTLPAVLVLDKYSNYQPLTFDEKIEYTTNEKLIKLIEFDKKRYLSLHQEFKDLKNIKHKLPSKEYLYRLISIQTTIEQRTKDFSP